VDEFKKVLALVATTFKAFTSGFKDIQDIKQGKKEKATLSREEEPSLVFREGG